MSRGGQAEAVSFDGLGLKINSSGWFLGFGRKTVDAFGAVKVRAEGTWRHLRACFEVKGSRRGAVSIRYIYENLDDFAPTWASSATIGVFSIFCSSGFRR